METLITVFFEYSDAHMCINDTESVVNKIEKRCKKLCEVFDFEYRITSKRLDNIPNLTFYIFFNKNLLTFQHYMNVLMAFAQDFQLNMVNLVEEE